MKQYVIDQLREQDCEAILGYLEQHADSTVMEEIFWLHLPVELYSEIQASHQECQPYYFAVNLTRRQMSLEWLIRSRTKLRCNCIAYATPRQRDFIIEFADRLLDELSIKV